MKKLLLLLLLFNCYCSSKVPTSLDEFLYDSLKHDLVDAEKQRKKCENMRKLLLLSADPKDEALMYTLATYDCYLSSYGYKKPNYSNSSSSSKSSEN